MYNVRHGLISDIVKLSNSTLFTSYQVLFYCTSIFEVSSFKGLHLQKYLNI